MNFKFYDSVDHFRPKSKTNKEYPCFSELIIKSADTIALYSDPDTPIEIYPKSKELIQDPFGCIVVLLSLSYMRPNYSSYYLFERLEREIWNRAKLANFEGRWRVVGELLQIDLYKFGINGRLERFFQFYSEDAFFGTVLPRMYMIFYKNKLIIKPQYSQEYEFKLKKFRSKVKWPVRSEYRDKGATTPNHERHGLRGKPIDFDSIPEKDPEIERLKSSDLALPKKRYWYQMFPKVRGSDRVVINSEGKLQLITQKQKEEMNNDREKSTRTNRRRKKRQTRNTQKEI